MTWIAYAFVAFYGTMLCFFCLENYKEVVMKVILGFIVFAMIVFVTFGLPLSFFFASALMLKVVLIVVGIGVLFFWALFLVELFERVGINHD